MGKPPHKLRFAVLATDVVCFTVDEGKLKVLLIPAVADKGKLALPGGLIHPKETAEKAARRHLLVKGGMKSDYLEQLYTFSAVKRDRRGRVVSVA